MDASDPRRLMHAVLDGEASPDERAELKRLLAEDPTARAEFESVRRLFDGLAALPRAMPPSGFVERTVAALPRGRGRGAAARQLLAKSGVIEPSESDIRVRNVTKRVNTSRTASEAIWGSEHMSKSKRSLWIVGGVAAAVVAMFVGGVVDFPPKGDNATGTIAPAERHRGQQPSEIKLNEGSGGATTRPVLATEPVPGNQGLGASNQGLGASNQGLGSSNQGLGSSNQGIGSSNQGIGSSNQGLGSSNQGVGSSNQGIGSSNQGIGSSNQGLGSSNQGIGSSNQGIGSSNQGIGSSNQGIGSSNQGIGSSNQGIGSSNQGIGSSNQGLGSSNQGIGASNQGVGSSNQGAGMGNKGVGASNQGVGAANQGVGAANQGVGAVNQGVGAANQGIGAANQGLGAANQGIGAANQGVGSSNKAQMGNQGATGTR